MPTEKQIVNYIDKHIKALNDDAERLYTLQKEQPSNSHAYAVQINGRVSSIETLEDMKDYIAGRPRQPIEPPRPSTVPEALHESSERDRADTDNPA